MWAAAQGEGGGVRAEGEEELAQEREKGEER